ncbi:MFS general substrate transporter [Xylaria sp. FL1042]|nr:MFS general substrate transporter [Xylaria sp. FL1042]
MSPRPGIASSSAGRVEISKPDPTRLGFDEPRNEVEFKIGKREYLILFTLGALNIVTALDATAFPPVLPKLSKDLGGTAIETFWTGSAYLLATAIFVPFLGALSELFGRRAVLLLSIVMFSTGVLICSVAESFPTFLAGRAIQGVGGGGIETLTYTIVSDIIPLRQRPKYLAFIVAGWTFGSIIGPVTGGLVADHAQWQWIFYINYPFSALSLLTVPFALRRLKLQNQPTFLTAMLRIDWIGSFLFIAGISSLLIGLTWGGVQYRWDSYQTWLPIFLGLLATILSVVYEAYVPLIPLIRLSVWNNISACLVFVLAIVVGFQVYAQLFYVPLYLICVKGLSATLTGVYLMATLLLVLPISLISGALITRFGSFLWSIQLGFACLVVSNGVFLLISRHRSLVAHLFLILTLSVGDGLVILSVNIAAQAIASRRNVAYAASMFLFMRQVGACLGVAIGGTVFQNMLQEALERHEFLHEAALETSRNAVAVSDTFAALHDGPEKIALLDSFVEGFHGIFYLLLALATASLVLSLFVRHHDMNKQVESEHQLEGSVSTTQA